MVCCQQLQFSYRPLRGTEMCFTSFHTCSVAADLQYSPSSRIRSVSNASLYLFSNHLGHAYRYKGTCYECYNNVDLIAIKATASPVSTCSVPEMESLTLSFAFISCSVSFFHVRNVSRALISILQSLGCWPVYITATS